MLTIPPPRVVASLHQVTLSMKGQSNFVYHHTNMKMEATLVQVVTGEKCLIPSSVIVLYVTPEERATVTALRSTNVSKRTVMKAQDSGELARLNKA